MLDRREELLDARFAELAAAPGKRFALAGKLRRRPESPPNSGFRAALDQHGARAIFAALCDEEHGLARGPHAPRFRAGKLGLPPLASGDADLAHRTYRACGPNTRAEGRAEIHDALRI